MDMRRLFLFLIFSFSLVVLWGEWTRQNQPPAPPTPSASVTTDPSVPSPTVQPVQTAAVSAPAPAEAQKTTTGKKITVTTDAFVAEISTMGGNLQHLDLLQHRDANDKSKPITLLQDRGGHTYLAQSGLLGKDLPTHNAEFTATAEEFKLADGKDAVEVRLTAVGTGTTRVTKVYTFHRASYVIDVAYEIVNQGTTALTSPWPA